MRIFLAGYSQGNGRTYKPENLRHKAKELDAIVLDIRLKPYSSINPDWSRQPLEDLLGRRYRWFGTWWGNEAVGTGVIQIKNWEIGLEKFFKLLDKEQPEAVILLCGCRSPHMCHRGVVGTRLEREEGFALDNLSWKIKTQVQMALAL